MKRLTVDQTWEHTLSMWKWISRQCKGVPHPDIHHLKGVWLAKNGYDKYELEHRCFFL